MHGQQNIKISHIITAPTEKTRQLNSVYYSVQIKHLQSYTSFSPYDSVHSWLSTI